MTHIYFCVGVQICFIVNQQTPGTVEPTVPTAHSLRQFVHNDNKNPEKLSSSGSLMVMIWYFLGRALLISVFFFAVPVTAVIIGKWTHTKQTP